MIEVHAEFPQREVIQANAVVDNEEKTVSEVIISAKPEITGVTASIDNETGTPYVDVTETGTGTDFSFDLAFHNLKGDKGEQGETGQTGNGIVSITKTATVGLEDDYTINFTNGTQTVYTVTNGADGQDGTDGTDGQDGFSPTASVSQSGGVTTISITDKNGTTTESIDLSSYATQTDLTNGLATKQDTISDLSTIRSNAANGQSAYTTIGGYGDIVTHNTSEFATSAQGNLADTSIQPNDNITLLNNNAGFITGIDSTDVITALGYTPYDSTNPNGYTSNVGTVTSVNNTQPDANGDVTLTIPTVNDGILTITQNGTSKGTFSANQSTNGTIALTDTTYNAFTGADGTNAGSSGLVPAPSATDNDKYLKGDGTWASVSSGSSTDVQINGTSITSGGVANIITNTAYNASSNKIATMSDLPDSEIFIATYGTTTFAEITGALSQNKAIICKNSNNYYSYANAANNSYYFTYATGGGYIFQVSVSSSDVWNTSATYMAETTSNKTSTISSSSTSTQYPSASAIIDLLKTIYPVGSVYLSTNSTCPLSSLFGTWTLVSSGKALWTGTGSNGNTTIAAGLPNIKGKIQGETENLSGAFTLSSTFSLKNSISSSSSTKRGEISFSAASSNSIYSDSVTTVQPPAYVVNVWRRTA